MDKMALDQKFLSFFSFLLLNIALPMLHTHLSPPPEVCGTLTRQHITSSLRTLETSSPMQQLAGYRIMIVLSVILISMSKYYGKWMTSQTCM
jgi:hypothetical protein